MQQCREDFASGDETNHRNKQNEDPRAKNDVIRHEENLIG